MSNATTVLIDLHAHAPGGRVWSSMGDQEQEAVRLFYGREPYPGEKTDLYHYHFDEDGSVLYAD